MVVHKHIKGRYKDLYMFNEKGGVEELGTLPPGVYDVIDIGGMMYSALAYRPTKNPEKYITFTGGVIGEALDRARDFFTPETTEKYKDLGISHKTAIILYGPPGTGKTVTGRIIMDELVEKYKAIGLVFNTRAEFRLIRWAVNEISKLKQPVVIFIDECEHTFKVNELEWLTFLDGSDSVQNCITLGCTNYLDLISSRLQRPSRLEHLIEVVGLEYEVALQYLGTKLPKMPDDLKKAIAFIGTESGATIDEFKNGIKEFYIHGKSDKAEEFKTIIDKYKKARKSDNIQAYINKMGLGLDNE